MDKIKVGLIFGGKSAEHEVSLKSAINIFNALDKDKYEPKLIGIAKTGEWLLVEQDFFSENSDDKATVSERDGVKIAFAPQGKGEIVGIENGGIGISVDVVFPILHGPFGEDGTVQGLLKVADVPFVGADVLGSAIGMDKDVMKRLLRDAGIPVAKFLTATVNDALDFDDVVRKLQLPFFVKPANLGSSVGISKVRQMDEFKKAIADAFLHDKKIIIEENIDGREIECAVLGNDDPVASVPGEIIPSHEFYSYEAKYIDDNGAKLVIPAVLPEDISKNVRECAIKTFKVLCCEGLGRVDFFLKADGSLLVNEINTLPGFTSMSMYPKLWEASGIAYSDLIDRLLSLAIERHKRQDYQYEYKF